MLDLRNLSESLAMPVARLRYVVNQKLVPFRDWEMADDEVGKPLKFGFVDCVYIACAAFLLAAGQKRDSVRFILATMSKVMPEGRNPLNYPTIAKALLVHREQPVHVQIADKARIRWKVGKENSGWLKIDSLRVLDDEFEPIVVVAIDFGRIRDMVRGIFPKE